MTNKNIQSRRTFLGMLAGGLVSVITGCESEAERNTNLKSQRQANEEYHKKCLEIQAKKEKLATDLAQTRMQKRNMKIEHEMHFENYDGTSDSYYPVEILIANYDGWTVKYIDTASKELREVRLYNYQSNLNTKLLVDLDSEAQPFVEIIGEFHSSWTGNHYDATIHTCRPQLQKIAAGDDAYRVKSGKTYKTVHEKRTIVDTNKSEEK